MRIINLTCLLMIIAGMPHYARKSADAYSGTRFVSTSISPADTAGSMLNLEVGYSKKVFYSVDVKDAAAAAHIIILKIVEKTGISIRLTTSVYEDMEHIIKDLKGKKLDLITVLSEDLPVLMQHHVVDPFLIEVEEEQLFENFVICMRKNRSESGLASLAGRKIAISIWVDSDLPVYWLELLLHERNLPDAGTFFSIADRIRNPEQAIMQVFFHNMDACLVPRQAYDVLKEMNPQIADEITIVAESPDFINGVLCLNKTLTEKDKRSLIEEKLLKLKNEVGGRQMMDLFRVYDFLPYEEHYLHDTYEVIRQYNDLVKRRTVNPELGRQ